MFNQFRNRTTSAKAIPPPISPPILDTASSHPLLGTPSTRATDSSALASEAQLPSAPRNSVDSDRSTSSIPGPLPYKARQRHDRIASASSAISHGRTNSGSTVDTPETGPLNAQPTPTINSPSLLLPTFATPPVSTATSSTSFFSPTSATGTSATTTTTFSPSPTTTGASGNVSLTTRLQLQSLKAGGQRIGLPNASWGMKALDTLFEKAQTAGQSGSGASTEWQEVVRILTTGGATLLLPTSPASGLPITAGWMRDHVVFVSESEARPLTDPDGGSSIKEPARQTVVTMSGLVGHSDGLNLVFESALTPDNQLLHDLRDSGKRASGLSSLQSTISPSSDSYACYPSFPLLDVSSTLPFPPAPSAGSAPLLASPSTVARSRSGSNASLTSLQLIPSQAGRLNPFASLFGHGSSVSSQADKGHTNGASTPPRGVTGAITESGPGSPEIAGSSTASSSLFESPSKAPSFIAPESHDEGYQIPGWVVTSVVKYAEVAKLMSKALRRTVQDELKGLPDKTVDRVAKFVLASHPSQTEARINGATSLLPATPTSTDTVLKFVSADELSHTVQAFLESVYDELFAHYVAPDSPLALGLRRKGSTQLSRPGASSASPTSPGGLESMKRKERDRRATEEQAERSATTGTDLVEGILCGIFYNGLFRPPNSDDEKHDEALASRIAALNLLDLSLDHLGVMVKDDDGGRLTGDAKATRDELVRTGLESITQEVGQVLQSLNEPGSHGPKTKADVLIRAHKLITDGLSTLPKIRLRPDGEEFVPPASTVEDADNVDNPSPLNSSSFDQQTPRPIQDQFEAPETPLPRLELPDGVEHNELEEAMSGSITDGRVPAAINDTSTLSGGTSGADLLLPIMIFAVVKANPSRLVSQLLYVQRYRSHVCQSGEASYAVVNTTAVVEFLENVDLAELGLSSSDKVFSVADLAPIGIGYLDSQHADTESIASASSRLRGRVLQVGELAGSAAGSANKVLTGVVDSGWGALRTLIAPNLALASTPPTVDVSDPPVRPRNARKASNFSLANVTASVASIAGAAAQRERPRASSSVTREMVDVSSRPASIRERGEGSASELDSSEDEDHDTEDEDQTAMHRMPSSDSRSIRSASSRFDQERPERVSLSDRFANLVGPAGKLAVERSDGGVRGAVSPGLENSNKNSFLANLTAPRGGTAASRRTTILNPSSTQEVTSAQHDHPSSPSTPTAHAHPDEIAVPPIDRFMTCDLADLKLSELGELLRDYRRLADIVTSRGS